jgi:hypothetical protein
MTDSVRSKHRDLPLVQPRQAGHQLNQADRSMADGMEQVAADEDRG